MTLRNSLLWIIGLIILTTAVFLLGFEEIIASIKLVNLRTLVILLLLQVLTLLVSALQWQFLFRKSKQNLSLVLVFLITLAGNYIESVTPAVKLGGEAAKVYFFRQHSSLDYDRLTGMLIALKYYSMLPFVCIAMILVGTTFINYNLPHAALGVFSFLILFFTVTALIYHKTGKNSVSGSTRPVSAHWLSGADNNLHLSILSKSFLFFINGLDKIAKFVSRAVIYSHSMINRLESLVLVASSTLVWIVYPIKTYLIARMLGLEIGLFSISVITFTAYLISMVPLLPGGLGSFEATMAFMFSLNGFSPAEGLTVALLTRLVTYWFPLLLSALGAAYLTFIKTSNLTGGSEKIACQGSNVGPRP